MGISNALLFIWYILVNGAVWVVGGNSIVETYIAAIPFDIKLAISTGLYIFLFHSAERILDGFFRIKDRKLTRQIYELNRFLLY
jgi:hypothetical protein